MIVADTVVAYCSLLLIPISIGLGTINVVHFYHFYKQRQIRFLQTRKPPLIIIYCIIASISSLLTLPYISFAHVMCHQHDIEKSAEIWGIDAIKRESRLNIINTKWIFEFLHEISTCFLIEIIAIRSWCLYYDYKLAIARTERIWRLQINSEESNIWINGKKYIGNYKFILYLLSSLSFCVLSLFLILHITIDLDLYGFMADFTASIPISIFILWLYSKIKDTKDQYMIKHELKRLSVCVAIIICSFTIWIIKEGWIDRYNLYNSESVDVHLLMYSADIVFVFFTVYFQTKWVIQQSNIHKERVRRTKYSYNSSRSLNNSRSNTKELRMVDVLRSKNGFKAFINHCVEELNVEGLLFLVEVSQFKATLNEYHVGETLNEYNINVINENLPRMLIEAKQEREEDINPEVVESGTISRGPSLRKRVSAMVKGMGISTENIKFAPNPLQSSICKNSNQSIVISSHQSSNGSPFTLNNNNNNNKNNNISIPPLSLQLNNYSSHSALPPNRTVLKPKRSNTLREDTFKKFQEDILERGWLPISTTLKPETAQTNGDCDQLVIEEDEEQEIEEIEEIHVKDIKDADRTMITPPPSNHSTPITQNSPNPNERIMRFSQLRHLSIGEPHPSAKSINSKLQKGSSAPIHSNNNSPSPIKLVSSMDDRTDLFQQQEEEQKCDNKKHKKMRIGDSFIYSIKMMKAKSNSSMDTMHNHNNHNTTTVDEKWIFQFCQYLYIKYIDISSELCINLSGNTRYDLVRFFQLNNDKDAFHFIRNLHFHELTEEEKEIITNDADHDITLIKTYLYHCFDVAFNDIWALLRDDVFLRFQLTEQYQQLNILNHPKLNKKSSKQRTSSNPQKIQTPTIGTLGSTEMTEITDETTSNNQKSQTLNNIYTPSQKPTETHIEIPMTLKYNLYSDQLDDDDDDDDDDDEEDMEGFEILEPDKINAVIHDQVQNDKKHKE